MTESKSKSSLYENPAFILSQISLAEAELEQYRQTAVNEIKFREGVIHALRQMAKNEAVLNEGPTPPLAVVDNPPA